MGFGLISKALGGAGEAMAVVSLDKIKSNVMAERDQRLADLQRRNTMDAAKYSYDLQQQPYREAEEEIAAGAPKPMTDELGTPIPPRKDEVDAENARKAEIYRKKGLPGVGYQIETLGETRRGREEQTTLHREDRVSRENIAKTQADLERQRISLEGARVGLAKQQFQLAKQQAELAIESGTLDLEQKKTLSKLTKQFLSSTDPEEIEALTTKLYAMQGKKRFEQLKQKDPLTQTESTVGVLDEVTGQPRYFKGQGANDKKSGVNWGSFVTGNSSSGLVREPTDEDVRNTPKPGPNIRRLPSVGDGR